MDTKTKKKRFPTAMVVAFVLAGSCVPCTGIMAAIAIPSLLGYVRRTKAAEASANLRVLASGVESAYQTNRELPPSLPRTPDVPSSQRQAWPADAAPGFAELGFAPMEPIYYSYEYVRDSDGLGFSLFAYGDLDGDTVQSRFEQRGIVDRATGTLRLEPLMIHDELE